MKKSFISFIIFSWIFFLINSAGAVVKKYQGTGELYLSDNLIDEYYNYVTKPLNKLPLVFFISEDQTKFYSSIINNDGGGFAGSATILKKKNKCESKLKQKCNLFSNVRYIVWDNGINPFNENDSKINSKISKNELISKLTKLGFIIDEEKKRAKEKAAKEKKLAEEKAAKEKKLAEEKAAKEKKLAEEKAAKEKAAKEKAAREKEEKKISLMPVETDLEKAQNFLNNLRDFIKLYPDEFDIVKVSKFFIQTKPILDGELNFKLKENLKLLKEFTRNSETFVDYNDEIEKNKKKEKLNTIDQAYIDLEANIKIIKRFMTEFSDSSNLEVWLDNIMKAEEILESPESYEQLLSTSGNLQKLIKERKEFEVASTQAKYTIGSLKDILRDNLTTELAPLIIEQIALLEKALNDEIIKNLISTNSNAEDFIFNKIEEPKRLAKEKAAKEKKLAEEKARIEYLKSPEGQKEEKERIKKEKERLAEEKRLKNFKPISMNCTYSGQGGIKNYKWVFDGKNINWQGMDLKVGGEIDDGMGTKISTKKVEGRDNFQLDVVAGFIPMTLSVNFDQRSSVMETMGIKIYGTCY